MFNKQQPNYSKQIEEILKSTEEKAAIESFQILGKSIAIFFLSLCEQGLKREEALILTKEYMVVLFNSTRK